MITLKLNQYASMEGSLKSLVESFNSIKINDSAASYITGKPVTELDTAAVLLQQKYDKASTLTNFIEYQNAGINLSLAVPDCADTKAALEAITELVNGYTRTDSKREVKYIAYDRKVKQFTVTAAGKQALQDAIVTLSGAEETAYNAIIAAHTAVLAANPNRIRKFFSPDVMNTFANTNLRADDVVYFLKLK